MLEASAVVSTAKLIQMLERLQRPVEQTAVKYHAARRSPFAFAPPVARMLLRFCRADAGWVFLPRGR